MRGQFSSNEVAKGPVDLFHLQECKSESQRVNVWRENSLWQLLFFICFVQSSQKQEWFITKYISSGKHWVHCIDVASAVTESLSEPSALVHCFQTRLISYYARSLTSSRSSRIKRYVMFQPGKTSDENFAAMPFLCTKKKLVDSLNQLKMQQVHPVFFCKKI